MAHTETLPGGATKVTASHEERRPKRKKLRRLSVQRAKNGGHTVEHDYHSNGDGYEPPTTHVFGKGEGSALIQHLRRHLGIVDGHAGAAGVQEQVLEPDDE